MDLKRIFDVFSRRPETAVKPEHSVPQSTRNRVLFWCRELYDNSRSDFGGYSGGNYNTDFWQEIYRRLLLRNGRLQLFQSHQPEDFSQAIRYVLSCPGEEFLNFLEDIFNVECFFHVNRDATRAVDELNHLLQIDNLPYAVTHFVIETVEETSGRHAGRTSIYTRAYPKVIMKESEVLHHNVIAPALALLQKPYFRGANTEYLAALEDYRKGDIGDCLTKCGSSFESLLKVICERKRWRYSQTDTASTLVKQVLPNTELDGYFEPLLIIVATLRNRLSSAHGAGVAIKQPPRHIAHYALNVTASAMLLLAQETGL